MRVFPSTLDDWILLKKINKNNLRVKSLQTNSSIASGFKFKGLEWKLGDSLIRWGKRCKGGGWKNLNDETIDEKIDFEGLEEKIERIIMEEVDINSTLSERKIYFKTRMS